MGKHEPLTAKAIGKRIKAKGLQKLKFYCQMCQKQCRDANGFKCHLTSEAHQRQLLLFSENPNRYMDEFSSEFMKDFLHLLKRRYSTKRVLANQVYQEYIKDRNHLHMNSTRWCTLTGFVKWMGRKGICHVEENEKGLFMTYIDRDPETLVRNEKKMKRDKLSKTEDARNSQRIQEQIEHGKQCDTLDQNKNDLEMSKNDEDDSKHFLNVDSLNEKIQFSMPVRKKIDSKMNKIESNFMNFSDDFETKIKTSPKSDVHNDSNVKSISQEDNSKGWNLLKMIIDTKLTIINLFSIGAKLKEKHSMKRSVLDDIIKEHESWKSKKFQKYSQKKNLFPTSWLLEGIDVRVICEELGQQYHNKKGRIESVDNHSAMVRMMANNHLIRVDERNLQTIIPSKLGSKVLVLKGLYRSYQGIIDRIDLENEKISIKIIGSSSDQSHEFDFDEVSKLSVC